MLELSARLAEAEVAAEVRTIAHRLHGSGASYGFPAISSAGQAAERAEPEALAEALAALLATLDQERTA